MKRLIYQVYVGKKSKLYDTCVASVKRYCEKYGIDHKIQTIPKLRIKPDVFAMNRSMESFEKHGGFLPIYEKENAFEYFPEYDQIAIVDADIYIRDTAPNIFEELTEEYSFGGCVEREMPLNKEYQAKIQNYSRMQYSTLQDVDWKWTRDGAEFFNMGLMVMNKSIAEYFRGQTPHEFITRPEFKRFVDGLGAWKWSTDQTLLNWWVKKEDIPRKHLSWKYNALFTGVWNTKIPEAHFVHFFLRDKLPDRGEGIQKIIERLKL